MSQPQPMYLDSLLSSFIFHHIFFPLKLPQEAEQNLVDLENRMVVVVRDVLREFIQNGSPESQQRWNLAANMLDSWVGLHTEQGIWQNGLEKALFNLAATGAIACHIRAQNCGWVAFYDKDEDRILVDAFEVSSQDESVLSSEGLLRRFPGVSLAISAEKLADPLFRSYLAATISQLASEEVSEMMPKSTKAGTEMDEIREAIHPGLVTEGLMTQLLALGTHNEEAKLVKCVRDEVNWKSALLPWRRSPAWLVIRVALQLVLRRCFPEDARIQYKNFILYLMATLAANKNMSMAPGKSAAVDFWKISYCRIGRRIYKLEGESFPFVVKRAYATSRYLLGRLVSIQKQIKTSNQVTIPLIPSSASQEDLHLSLVYSKDWFQLAMSSSPVQVQPTKFCRTYTPNLNWINGLPIPKFGSIMALTEFEQWVDEHLESWFINQLDSNYEAACCDLENVITQYYSLAQVKHALNPQATSVMVLVVLELWVVLDKMALRLCPLLEMFPPPGIPEDFLRPLLLPKMGQMERGRDIERHLNMRRKDALKGNPSIFSDPAPNCFAVQYFDSSVEHQQLEQKIEEHATKARASKRAEWQSLSDKYKQLCNDGEAMTHFHDYDYYGQYVHIQGRCNKCDLKRQAESLCIEVHEWPLPDHVIAHKTAVFELNIPIWFSSWRNTSWRVLHDIGRKSVGTVATDDMEVEWLGYQRVQAFAIRRGSNIVLASDTKPWGNSHYNNHKFPVSLSTICIRNALRLRPFDKTLNAWVTDQTAKPTVKPMCTIRLPVCEYSNLQYALDYTSHTQNDVMANQNDCDKMLSLHEFEAYGCLRSGENLQWFNIVRNLASSALSLNEDAVVYLFKQAAWELGTPCGSVRRHAHKAFEDTGFGDCLLQLLRERLMTIKKNWNQYCTFDLLVALGIRALALSSVLVEKFVEFLRQCRQVAMDWCDELNRGLFKDEEKDDRRQQDLLLRIASTCQASYDVDAILLDSVLKTPQDLSCFSRCSMLLFENSPSETNGLSPEIKICLENSERVRWISKSQIACMITESPSGLNEAIQSSVNCLQVSGPWRVCDESGNWVTTETSNSAQGFHQRLHFNYLTGELLVDGNPPGRLPAEFMSNPLYQRLFGPRTIPVIPSSLPGASFVMSYTIEDFEVHFGMRSGRLLIKTRKGSQILQLIPQDVLEKDFPRVFISDNFHWLDLETGVVEFRPVNEPWKPCHHNWHLFFDPHAPSEMLIQQDCKTLVDIHSPLFTQLASILKVLDVEEEIVVIQTAAGTLEAELSRLRLKFFVNEDGRVASKEFDALIDVDQDIGCFYGLKNKLALVDSSDNKSVIVPYGCPIVTRKDQHVAVNINPPTGYRVKYMHYCLDNHLQLLRGFYPLAILYQAHLHALTSFPVPDDLTHRSGTEEAIRILRQGCLRSSFPLQDDCIETLERIAALTPHRTFYPRHLRVMQTVTWSNNLGQLVQHDDFQPLSQEILQFSEQCSHFHDAKPRENRISYRGSTDLLRRASYRNEQIRTSEFSGPLTPSRKNIYNSRDCNITSTRSRNVYAIATLIREWPATVDHSSTLVATMRHLKGVSTLSADFTRSSFSQILDQTIESAWVALFKTCQESARAKHTYFLISLFSTIAFGGKIDLSTLRQLLHVAFSFKCKYMEVPCDSITSLDLTLGEDFIPAQIENTIRCSYVWFTNIRRDPNLTWRENSEKARAAQIKWEEQKSNDVRLCVEHTQKQWPCEAPQLPSSYLIPLVLREGAYQECKNLCGNWFRNRNFLNFLRRVQSELPPSKSTGHDVVPVPTPMPLQEIEYSPFKPPGLFDLIRNSRPNLPQTLFGPVTYYGASSILQPTPELWALAKHFQDSSNPYQQNYGNGLGHSVQALDHFSTSVPTARNTEIPASFDWPTKGNALFSHQKELQKQRDLLWHEIITTLRMVGKRSPWKADTVCPSITVWSVLSILASAQWTDVSVQWRALLVAFGKSISSLRRCERLISCIEKQDMDGFSKDAENPGYEGWDPLRYPTWLLLEIENNITIRKRQVEVALRMIQPDDGENALLQLNMGEGKTSVIIPMAGAALADGQKLLRIIVLKPLLRQSDALLSQRLGGLMNRHIYHIPFSRQTKLSSTTVDQLNSIYKQCRCNRGILIALPEQILSFRLIGLDAAERNPDMLTPLVNLENWLQKNCRDVIDESDEVLDTKFQLVYTMGMQQSLDGLSGRWETTQHLLRLVSIQASRLHQDDPRCIEVEAHQSGYRYPILRFLKPNAVDRLIDYTFTAIAENGIPGLPFTQWTSRVKGSVLRFIEHSEPTKEDESIIQEEFNGSIFITKLLVLRGLFAHRILKFSLADKRWLVEYGLHPSRCLMAVPYRAKGVPSESAEFGHPDVAVTLTCLSYYYEGLTKERLRDCFKLLAKENDPSTEFQNWIAHCVDDLPPGLKTYSGVNLQDDKNFSQTLFPILRYQKEILDFYLSRFVFSREAKEFPRKLSSSAWDIPARPDLQLTTGFSGTNDNRFLLPLSIRQRDLSELLHTNAMVLGLLLREDNRQCILAQDEEGRQLDVDRLLKLVVSTGGGSSTAQPVRVLIDVGAQILEAGNQSVAQKWLAMTPEVDVEAAIFFNHSDEIMVIDREGHVETLLSSSFRQRMGACLVFLDQHHSRGVDLKLPPATRAAVTLGPRLTKDRLVQACNRLRGLEKCQSLLFLVPPEVNHNMRFILGISSDREFTSEDVLKWSMVQTCQTLDNLRPLWANQGLQYLKKISLWDLLVEQGASSKETAISMQESEARTLSQLYAPWGKDKVITSDDKTPEWHLKNGQAQELLKVLQSTAGHVMASGYLHEEQEREIACEVEREQQVSRPPSYTPNKHNLHNAIRYFAKTGMFPTNQMSKAVTLAFQGLANTSAGKEYYPNVLGPGLYSTLDFNQTVKISRNDFMDDFCKQVNWILSSIHSDILIIVSQYEANELVDTVRKSKNARLNIYAPRLTKPMRSFRHLDFFGIGADFPSQPNDMMKQCLELFAGSLYFSSFKDYKDFRSFLGLLTDEIGEIPDGGMTNEGFVKLFARLQLQWPLGCSFFECPLPFLGALIHIRTKGNGYQQSHLGTIIKAMPLSTERF